MIQTMAPLTCSLSSARPKGSIRSLCDSVEEHVARPLLRNLCGNFDTADATDSRAEMVSVLTSTRIREPANILCEAGIN